MNKIFRKQNVSTLIVRLAVGLIFLSEGLQKSDLVILLSGLTLQARLKLFAAY
jgi:uncharacterized membrane protein YphA (DoxX/SURF4 family)